MAFQRLNIRARKSFPALHSFDKADGCRNTETMVMQYESPSPSVSPKDVKDYNLDDFGASLERCKGSSSRESPSKRKRLLGSLRSLRSLANLQSLSTKTMQTGTPRAESPVKRQESCATPLPMSASLELNFEQSPPDQPIFELNMPHRSTSGPSLEVQHSSPMIVPGSARSSIPYKIYPVSTTLPAGTIPDTPGPLQRAFERDSENHVPWHNTSSTPVERCPPSAPVLTPMPGTNLFVEDLDPEFVSLPPSINPAVGQINHDKLGYFDIPRYDQPPMSNMDMLNGLACLRLADGDVDTVDQKSETSADTRRHMCPGQCGGSEEMRCGHEGAKLKDTVCKQGTFQHQTHALRRKQRAKDLYDGIRILNVPQTYQTLPLRLKQQDEDLQDRVRKDSIISEDWETSSSEDSTVSQSDHTNEDRARYELCGTGCAADRPKSAFPAGFRDMGDGNSLTSEFTHTVCYSSAEFQPDLPAENTWGQHTGLYDGTGYGDDAASPSTPCEPDEGTTDVHMQFSPRSNGVSPAFRTRDTAPGARSTLGS